MKFSKKCSNIIHTLRPQDMLRHLHSKEYWKCGKYSHLRYMSKEYSQFRSGTVLYYIFQPLFHILQSTTFSKYFTQVGVFPFFFSAVSYG